MSKISMGETPVLLGDDELILKPTLGAMKELSRHYGGLAKVRQALVDENVDVVAHVLRLGSGMSPRDAKALPDRVYENGITTELLVPLIKYIGILGNGGKPLDEQSASDDRGGDHNDGAPHEGNG